MTKRSKSFVIVDFLYLALAILPIIFAIVLEILTRGQICVFALVFRALSGYNT